VKRILIVDDDDSIRDVLAELLSQEGYQTIEASDGNEAIVEVSFGMIDLILLDMRMPGADGWSFAAAMKERGSTIPIIVMSAGMETRKWATEIGATSHVNKPFDLAYLLGEVSRLTG
jgi:CheY-like chemotaxis protein